MKRIARFGKGMMPKKEKPKSVISKKPRPFRRMKMAKIKLEIIELLEDLED